MRCLLLSTFLFGSALSAAISPASRPARNWEFLDAVGQQAGLLGREDGSLDGYVYPLKVFADLQFSFEVTGRIIPAAAISRKVVFRSGSCSVIYTGDEFQVTETLIVPVHEPGAVIRLDVVAHDPVTIRFSFQRDFQLMWPASIGSAFGQWRPETGRFVFGADGQPYAAVLAGTNLQLESTDYATNYSAQARPAFTLGKVEARGTRYLAFAGSVHSLEEATQAEENLRQNAERFEHEAEAYYDSYLQRTVEPELPDKALQEAYDWSRLSLVKGMVDNPFLGTGLVAGYGPSKGTYRPGFAWFFGRDTFWSSFAFNSEGDWQSSRQAIDFIAKFQRDDGKIPHEISQTAGQVAWSKDYPYEYASADATPLFVSALRDYVQHSGDIEFGKKLWDRAAKAIAFSRSTLDEQGFPKNFGIGHGWVEGGPLLPVRVELYMAGCYVEGVRSLAQLARWTGHENEAAPLAGEAAEKQQKLDRLFWLEGSHAYAFAIGNDGRPVAEPSVLALVPEWWRLLSLPHTQAMIGALAAEAHASDWGMRIISSKAKLYSPAGYHFGSVWPLFTGWAAVSEYHAHEPVAAWANLKANSWLALDGPSRNTTEVLSGETYSPLSTASPHQIWSAAMVISPLLRGLFGLETDAAANHITLSPHLPADWNDATLRHIRLPDGSVDLALHRDAAALTLRVTNHATKPVHLTFAPAYSPYSSLSQATIEGRATRFEREDGGTDWHAKVDLDVQGGGASEVILRHKALFDIAVPADPPRLAEPSSNLKLVARQWSKGNKHLQLTFAGVAGRSYSFHAVGAENVSGLKGAERHGDRFDLPPFGSAEYQNKTVEIDLR